MRLPGVRCVILLAALLGLSFTVAAAPTPDTPRVTQLVIPPFPGAYAIWGATGNDSSGHVWFAVCADKVPLPSAHLFEMTPETGQIIDRGNVVSELDKAGLHRDGQRQMKIHTRIVQAADGNLYFASMDEEGEVEDGSRLPTWGSHFWRYRLAENRWEHLFAAPEGLIAVDTGGKWVYALGYFDHVLYQYDTVTGRSRSVHVGSVDGHISRNIFCDGRGHVYVPRLTRGAGHSAVEVSLVEYDPELHEVAKTPLTHYLEDTPTKCHGIVSFEHLADGSICFVTHAGWLFHVTPRSDGPAAVDQLGPIHPRGASYTASLFCPDGKRILFAVSKPRNAERFDWVRYDLDTHRCELRPFALDVPSHPPLDEALLYGSITRDQLGNCYVVGTHWQAHTPVLLRVKY